MKRTRMRGMACGVLGPSLPDSGEFGGTEHAFLAPHPAYAAGNRRDQKEQAHLRRSRPCGSYQALARARGMTLLIALTAALAGCSGKREDDKPKPIPECEVFLSSYDHCLLAMGDTAKAAKSRALTRESLYEEAAKAPDARDKLRLQCISESERLKISCR